MKTTLTIESPSKSKIDLLLSIAREMGITIINMGAYKIATDELLLVSEASLAEAWNSDEDNRWDELYNENKP